MPCTIHWYDEPRVLYIKTTGHLTLDELRAISREQETLIRGGEAPVHTIVDITHMENMNIRNLMQFRDAIVDPSTPGLGWTLIVGKDRMVQFFGNIAAQLSGNDFRVLDTVEAARALLMHVDSRLKDLKPLPDDLA